MPGTSAAVRRRPTEPSGCRAAPPRRRRPIRPPARPRQWPPAAGGRDHRASRGPKWNVRAQVSRLAPPAARLWPAPFSIESIHFRSPNKSYLSPIFVILLKRVALYFACFSPTPPGVLDLIVIREIFAPFVRRCCTQPPTNFIE